MKEQIVMDILREMTAILTQEQLMRLKEVVRVQLCGYDIRKKETALMRTDQNWLNYLQMYLDGFRQNGKSTGTIEQYNLHLSRMLSYVAKNVQDIEDDDLIAYMYKYRALRKVSNRYLNNMRLVFNCFFRWLQRRKVILRNPVDGLEPIKYRQVVKKPLSPEEFGDYEKNGGDGHMHTVVQPAMRALEVIPMHEADRVVELMQSRR